MYVDTILNSLRRQNSYVSKTGLYTSPHLVEVRERIQINGQPLSKELFTQYFSEVWAKVQENQETKITYFPFLTLLAFHAFLKERVSIATFETGIGGEYDVTNVIAHPLATGITTLGIDHVTKLGTSLPEIAWHKAGIFKTGCPALTVNQKPEALDVLRKRAMSRGIGLEVVFVSDELRSLRLQPNLPYQYENASLAVALVCRALELSESEVLNVDVKKDLEDATLRGRAQKIVGEGIVWYVDVAHTKESLDIATRWFLDTSALENGTAPLTRILIFNHQSERRDGKILLDSIHDVLRGGERFDHVIFCTNYVNQNDKSASPGRFPHSLSDLAANGKDLANHNVDTGVVVMMKVQNDYKTHWEVNGRHGKTFVQPDVISAISHAKILGGGKGHVFITGHPYLVGAALSILDGGTLKGLGF